MDEQMGSAQGRELGHELRQYREAIGLSGYDLAMRLGWSTSRISRVENGLIRIGEVDVVRYAAHCGVPADGIDALLEMCREPGAQGYWLSKWSSTLIFHENAAACSFHYNPLVVPGLLQTRDYAAALIKAEGLEPGLVQHRVDARMERQRMLRARPFQFFVHEQALRLRVGGNRVMNEQLLKLALLCGQPGITVQVVPASLGERSVFGGSFVHFRYRGHKPLIYLENQIVGFFLEDKEYVTKYHNSLADMSEFALGRAQSRALLAGLASEFDRPEEEDSPTAPVDLAKERLELGV